MNKSPMTEMYKYLRLVKFSHTIFAMPFAISGYFLALYMTNYNFNWKLLVYVVLCMVFARNAAMGFNRYIDREFDKKNPRTAGREIPQGKIKASSAMTFVIVNCVLFIICTGLINRLTLVLSPVALFLILSYSIVKRYSPLCHFILGTGLSLAPVGAYISVTGQFDLIPILYSFIVFFWCSGFDILYSLQDVDFDSSENLRSIPVLVGKRRALLISSMLHVASAFLVVFTGILAQFGLYYWIGAFIFIGMLAYQHLIVKPNDLSKINIAFATTNGIASIIFAIFNILQILL
jgi:4-hydroxybenzoate polyprenyltransferase